MSIGKVLLLAAGGYAALVFLQMAKADAGSATFAEQQKAESDTAYNVGIQSTDIRTVVDAYNKLTMNNDPRSFELAARARSLGLQDI